MIFDKWQQEIIDHEGSVTLRSGRQVGKSTTVGYRASRLMQKYPKSNSLMIAPSQRQSSELFIKTMSWLVKDHHAAIDAAGGYKDNPEATARRNMELRRIFEQKHGIFAEHPTKTMVKLKNGSICYSLPAGKTGIYLRTFTIDFLYIDEAAYVPEVVYNALRPMLAVPMKMKGLGWECFTSTPFGKGGFFYDSQFNDDYLIVYINSENCERVSKELLLKEKKRLSKIEYAQEWQGMFVDEFQQYFPTALIKKRMTFMRWVFKTEYRKDLKYFMGHDYAGPGKDDNASITAEMQSNRKNLKIIDVEEDEEPNTTIVNRKIVIKDEKFKYNRVIVDSGGFGCGPTDELTNLLGRKVLGLDNSKKSIAKKEWVPGMKPSADDEVRVKIFKEDLYSNARSMMERGEVDIINNLKLLRSLKCMTFKYTAGKRLEISGKYSHLAEAFVRACWAVKAKSLNLFVY